MNSDIGNIEPVVSVCLITYNHAPFIRECIDSMLCQKTDFPFEICIGEDESTDGTREICIEYAEKFPDRINLILRSRSEPRRTAYKSQGVYNYIETTKECRGKYLALCDGDDAWTDPLKLQKQFDIMEAHPEVALVHSDYDSIDDRSGRMVKSVYRKRKFIHHVNPDQSLFMCDIVLRLYPITASTVFVRTADVLEIFKMNAFVFSASPMGDIITWCELVNYGPFFYQDEASGIWRTLEESDSNSRSAEKKFCFVNDVSSYAVQVGERYDLPMDGIRSFKVKNCNRHALLSGELSEINRLYADGNFKFSFREYCVYQLSQLNAIRLFFKRLFELRYRINNYRF
jgi:glycosyltransferase involved in cell wall biosynthesis